MLKQNLFHSDVANFESRSPYPIDADQNLGFRVCRNALGLDETITTTAPLSITVPKISRILIAYISYSGNAENTAQMLTF